jgi:hypothetical protein
MDESLNGRVREDKKVVVELSGTRGEESKGEGGLDQ